MITVVMVNPTTVPMATIRVFSRKTDNHRIRLMPVSDEIIKMVIGKKRLIQIMKA
jgi:hypothetical protein